MSLYDVVNYALFTNPVSKYTFSGISSAAEMVGLKSAPKTIIIKEIDKSLYTLARGNTCFIRLAGLSGASAVALSAYVAFSEIKNDENEKYDLKANFETANKFHFFHSIVLLAMPLVHRPVFSGTMFMIGTALFCFPCYHTALTGKRKFNILTPIGEITLILAWMSLIL